jgi:hypothetical protein
MSIRKNIVLNAEMKGKALYVGDICYSLKDDVYTDVWDEKMNFNDGVIRVNGEAAAITVSTAFGDGIYEGSDGFNYGVDAGNIGITSSDFAQTENERHLRKIELPNNRADVTVEYKEKGGLILFDIKDGSTLSEHIEIPTMAEGESEEYEEEK